MNIFKSVFIDPCLDYSNTFHTGYGIEYSDVIVNNSNI